MFLVLFSIFWCNTVLLTDDLSVKLSMDLSGLWSVGPSVHSAFTQWQNYPDAEVFRRNIGPYDLNHKQWLFFSQGHEKIVSKSCHTRSSIILASGTAY